MANLFALAHKQIRQLQPAPNIATNRDLKPTIFWRVSKDIPYAWHFSFTVLSILVPFSLWWLVSNFIVVDSIFLPSPGRVGGAFISLWERGFLEADIVASVLRVGAGFLLAAIISIPIGILMGAFASIRALLEPITGIFRYMPAPAFIPLLILYLGIDESPKIALIFMGTVFYNILMIMDAVKFVPRELIETTYTLGGNRWQTLSRVITPYVVPNIIDTFRINVAASWNLVVVAELLAAEVGLGKRILIAQKFLNTDEIFAILAILGIMGFTIDLFFRRLLRGTAKWAVD